jgi:hypothetical protein
VGRRQDAAHNLSVLEPLLDRQRGTAVLSRQAGPTP